MTRALQPLTTGLAAALAAALAAWLAGRSARERALLACGAAALILAVLILGLWQPLRASRAADLARSARYDQLTRALAELPATTTTARPPPDPRPIAAVLTQTAAAQGLAILRLDTPLPDSASLTLQDAPFDTLILWIDGLTRDAGLAVTSITLRRSEATGLAASGIAASGIAATGLAASGIVSADLALTRSAP